MDDQPLVSVIIPTYNSEKTLAKCLESIRNQTYENIEIIIIDKFSKDKTIEIARKYRCRVYQYNCERTKAKNLGLKKAKGRYVLFIDSDMELTPNVTEECVELIERNEKIGGVIIPERSVGNSFWVRVRDFERSFYAGTEIESARFFKKDLALKVGGFDEDIIFFEEATLPIKIEQLGYNVRARITSEILHHEEDFSLLKWLTKKYYYGKTAQNYKQRYNNCWKKQMGIKCRLEIFLRNKRFYQKPILSLGVIFLKCLEYLFVLRGYLESARKCQTGEI